MMLRFRPGVYKCLSQELIRSHVFLLMYPATFSNIQVSCQKFFEYFVGFKLNTVESPLSESQSSETSNIRTHIFFVKILSAYISFFLKK